jgi:hypothetical protein
MHYIAADLDTDTWVEDGFARLERYLIRWSLFKDRGGDDAAWSDPDANRQKPE